MRSSRRNPARASTCGLAGCSRRGMTPDKVAEKIFDIVHQLNQGLQLISDWVEKERVAELNLQAGRKAKASTAYASACHYLAAGMDVLAEAAWQNCYNLTLELYLERAECEILSSSLQLAALLIEELLRSGRSKTDRAEACRLRMLLELKRGDYAPAVRTALECLRMFNLELPERPTPEHVAACGSSHPLGLLVHRVVSVPVVTSRKPSPQAARALSIRSLAASAVIPGGPRSGSWSRQRHASSVASIPCGGQVRQVNPKTGKRPVGSEIMTRVPAL